MENNLKGQTITGVFWSAVERFSLQGVQFVFSIIMARILAPADYGVVALLLVFLQISQIFIDCGFTNSLIQKNDRDDSDYSTVFYFNIVISFLFYIILFICAPYISNFYDLKILSPILRISAITLVINSLCTVHKTRFTIEINFKSQSKISLLAATVSGIVGIILAYNGSGVWSLVYQSIVNSIITTFLYYYFSRWYPCKRFSLFSFKKLFSFGSNLMLSSLLHRIYYNLYSLVIGKQFSPADLGYFNKAEQLAIFPSNNINSIISRVAFPILSKIQDDNTRLASAYRQYIKYTSLIIFPLMTGLAALADPVIEIMLTDKWINAVPLLQILCLDWMFDHICLINANVLYVKGRSDIVLKLEIIKKSIATLILFLSIPFGIIGICWGKVLYSLIATYLNTIYTRKFIGLSFTTQMKDIIPILCISLFMASSVLILNNFINNNIIHIILGIMLGAFVYICLILIFQRKMVSELFNLLKKYRCGF